MFRLQAEADLWDSYLLFWEDRQHFHICVLWSYQQLVLIYLSTRSESTIKGCFHTSVFFPLDKARKLPRSDSSLCVYLLQVAASSVACRHGNWNKYYQKSNQNNPFECRPAVFHCGNLANGNKLSYQWSVQLSISQVCHSWTGGSRPYQQECWCLRVTKSIQGRQRGGTFFTGLADSILEQCEVWHTGWEECLTSLLKVSVAAWHQTLLWKLPNCGRAAARRRNGWEGKEWNRTKDASGALRPCQAWDRCDFFFFLPYARLSPVL